MCDSQDQLTIHAATEFDRDVLLEVLKLKIRNSNLEFLIRSANPKIQLEVQTKNPIKFIDPGLRIETSK